MDDNIECYHSSCIEKLKIISIILLIITILINNRNLFSHFTSSIPCKPFGLPYRRGQRNLIRHCILAFSTVCLRCLCPCVFFYHPACHLLSLEQTPVRKGNNFPCYEATTTGLHSPCIYCRLGSVICSSFRLRFRISVL